LLFRLSAQSETRLATACMARTSAILISLSSRISL
jgi:hypothetical protein